MPVRYNKSGGGGGGPATPAFTEALSFQIGIADSSAAPTAALAYAIAMSQSDSNAAPSEAVKLTFPAGDFGDSNAASTDSKSLTMRVWLSQTALLSTNGVTNPSNADGQNDGAVATYSSAAAGDANPRTVSTLGTNVPTVAVTSVLLRGWFKSVNTATTSTTQLVLHSNTAAFSDVTMFTNTALNTTIDHSTGDFTFDVIAAGINTLAKIKSIQLLASTQDAVAGVTPAVLTLDAAALEIIGAF